MFKRNPDVYSVDSLVPRHRENKGSASSIPGRRKRQICRVRVLIPTIFIICVLATCIVLASLLIRQTDEEPNHDVNKLPIEEVAAAAAETFHEEYQKQELMEYLSHTVIAFPVDLRDNSTDKKLVPVIIPTKLKIPGGFGDEIEVDVLEITIPLPPGLDPSSTDFIKDLEKALEESFKTGERRKQSSPSRRKRQITESDVQVNITKTGQITNDSQLEVDFFVSVGGVPVNGVEVSEAMSTLTVTDLENIFKDLNVTVQGITHLGTVDQTISPSYSSSVSVALSEQVSITSSAVPIFSTVSVSQTDMPSQSVIVSSVIEGVTSSVPIFSTVSVSQTDIFSQTVIVSSVIEGVTSSVPEQSLETSSPSSVASPLYSSTQTLPLTSAGLDTSNPVSESSLDLQTQSSLLTSDLPMSTASGGTLPTSLASTPLYSSEQTVLPTSSGVDLPTSLASTPLYSSEQTVLPTSSGVDTSIPVFESSSDFQTQSSPSTPDLSMSTATGGSLQTSQLVTIQPSPVQTDSTVPSTTVTVQPVPQDNLLQMTIQLDIPVDHTSEVFRSELATALEESYKTGKQIITPTQSRRKRQTTGPDVQITNTSPLSNDILAVDFYVKENGQTVNNKEALKAFDALTDAEFQEFFKDLNVTFQGITLLENVDQTISPSYSSTVSVDLSEPVSMTPSSVPLFSTISSAISQTDMFSDSAIASSVVSDLTSSGPMETLDTSSVSTPIVSPGPTLLPSTSMILTTTSSAEPVVSTVPLASSSTDLPSESGIVSTDIESVSSSVPDQSFETASTSSIATVLPTISLIDTSITVVDSSLVFPTPSSPLMSDLSTLTASGGTLPTSLVSTPAYSSEQTALPTSSGVDTSSPVLESSVVAPTESIVTFTPDLSMSTVDLDTSTTSQMGTIQPTSPVQTDSVVPSSSVTTPPIALNNLLRIMLKLDSSVDYTSDEFRRKLADALKRAYLKGLERQREQAGVNRRKREVDDTYFTRTDIQIVKIFNQDNSGDSGTEMNKAVHFAVFNDGQVVSGIEAFAVLQRVNMTELHHLLNLQ